TWPSTIFWRAVEKPDICGPWKSGGFAAGKAGGIIGATPAKTQHCASRFRQADPTGGNSGSSTRRRARRVPKRSAKHLTNKVKRLVPRAAAKHETEAFEVEALFWARSTRYPDLIPRSGGA